jgi:hypothetical protein
MQNNVQSAGGCSAIVALQWFRISFATPPAKNNYIKGSDQN